MGLFSSECIHCGSKEHASSDCPHGIFSSNKCRHCGSVNHASDDCPHGVFSSNNCRHCGSLDHASDDCPHGVFSSNKCRHCGSVNHASDDCPHGVLSSNKCRNCGSLDHASDDCPQGIFASSSSSRTNTASQTSSPSSDESGCATMIAWLVGIGIVVFVAVWLAVNVVLPVALLNSALALAVLAFVFKKYKTLFAFLGLVGGGYMLLDIANGWLSVTFVEKVVKNPDWISAFVYINAAAIGLGAWLLIQPIWLKTEQMDPTEKRKSLLLKGALILLVVIATCFAPIIYHSVQNPFVHIKFVKVAELFLKKNKVIDIDGNVYHTVTIGKQVWMVENLKTTKLNDGTSIINVSNNTSWNQLKTPGYCWYNNNDTNKNIYGGLYNWYTVNTGKLAPTGWHVANENDWSTLVTFLGGEMAAGEKLKEKGESHWNMNWTGTNEYNFTALPSGQFNEDGFYSIGDYAYWWSSPTDGTDDICWRTVSVDGQPMEKKCISKNLGISVVGFAVRCIKD